MKNEIVLFTDGDVNIEVQINPEQETVWLTQKQMEVLFDVKHATVSEHISNILASGELDETSVGFSDRSTGGRKPKIYNLDMILSVGYRVNSKRGIAFRKWANNVLKQFILKGYAINEKRLQALKKTVDIQSRMLADALKLFVMLLCHMRSSFSMPLLYHAYVYLEFLILACTIYILAPRCRV